MAKYDDKGFVYELDENEVFVFGSNIEGQHMGGAASQAYINFGAIWGVGVGEMGQSYAIPTMFETIGEIRPYAKQFIETATNNPDKTYILTRVGCGIAGFTDDEMASLFIDVPENVIKPIEWR